METYTAISLLEPWATLLACSVKKIETRPKNWRLGPIAIHASARIEPTWRRVVDGEFLVPEARYYIDALRKLGIKSHRDLPRGCVIAISEIKDSYQFTDAMPLPDYPERAFGDYGVGRWGLWMPESRLLATPIPAKGSLGPWKWTTPGPLAFLDGGSPPPAYVARDVMVPRQLSLFR